MTKPALRLWRRGRRFDHPQYWLFRLSVLLGFDRQPVPTASHIDQEGFHSQTRRAPSHTPTFDTVFSTLGSSNHAVIWAKAIMRSSGHAVLWAKAHFIRWTDCSKLLTAPVRRSFFLCRLFCLAQTLPQPFARMDLGRCRGNSHAYISRVPSTSRTELR